MKNVLMLFVSMGLFLSFVGCTSDDPQFRVKNERQDKANVQMQTSGGNTININDVSAGQTTDYQTVAEGDAVANAVIQNETVSPTATFFCEMDERYTVVILPSNPPSLRIDH